MKRIFVFLLVIFIAGVGFVAWANLAAMLASRGRLYSHAADVPRTPVAMVLGTSPRTDGRENPYFRHRIDAAAELWKAGKVDSIIVSGDKDEAAHYDEPEKMRRELVKSGVPNAKIIAHNTGFSTIDSVRHAKHTFGLKSVVFVSQQFHNERAIYLARAMGIDACGFNARDVEPTVSFLPRLREIPARVKMWLDVNLPGG